ncbi:MAG: retroviral-like aspartic protease family protein [Planctomycetota bacterium]
MAALVVLSALAGQSVGDVIDRVRAAMHYDNLARCGGIRVRGDGEFFGTSGLWEMRLAPDGRMVETIDSRIGYSQGFDGAVAWSADHSGLTRTLALQAREVMELKSFVLTGRWLQPEAGAFTIELAPGSADELHLLLRHRHGHLEAQLCLDPRTWLPVQLATSSAMGGDVWVLGDYRPVLGFQYPHRLGHTRSGITNSIRVHQVAAEPGVFSPPPSAPRDVFFDGEQGARVACERAPSGHLLVHPRVNGRELGPFILDTGAGVTVIDRGAADALALPKFGKTSIGGAGAEIASAPLREAQELALGPVTLGSPVFTEMDLEPFAHALGAPVAGICGYDLLCRAVIGIDLATPAVEIHDPSAFVLAHGQWQELIVHGRHPHVRCRFEGDREGLFRLDTGAAPVSLIFHADAVERLGLLDGRASTPVAGMLGAGGALKADAGTLDWFELGGKRFPPMRVLFSRDQSGALVDRYVTGNVGGGYLGAFIVVFDYPHDRVAFVPHAAEPR